MFSALIAFGIAAQARPASFDFSHSYHFWVARDGLKCVYWLTDAGEKAKELTASLRGDGYKKQFGIEILTDRDSTKRCIAKAQKAAMDAGFEQINVRPGTERDRSPGIP